MGKKITIVLFLGLALLTIYLIIQLNITLGSISRGLLNDASFFQDPQYRIAFIYQNDNELFWESIRQGAREGSKDEGVYVNFFEATPGQELQINDYLRLAVNADYDGIILQGENERMIPLIDEAWDAQIPVLTIASDLPDSRRIGYVGANNYRVGFIAGKSLARMKYRRARPNFAVLSPLIGGDMQMSVAESLKVFGFREAISAKATNIPFWEKSNPTLLDSMAVVRSILKNHPNLDGIYATYPEGTLAAARVITERNNAAHLRIIGHGDLPEIREYIRKGVIDASIVEYPYQMGTTAVQEMLRYIKEGRVNISSNIEVIILNQTNLAQYPSGGE